MWVYVEEYQKSFSWTSLRPKLISYKSHKCKWDEYSEASLSNVSQIRNIITLLHEMCVCPESHRHSCDCLQRVLFPQNVPSLSWSGDKLRRRDRGHLVRLKTGEHIQLSKCWSATTDWLSHSCPPWKSWLLIFSVCCCWSYPKHWHAAFVWVSPYGSEVHQRRV